jgi:guanine deaminase
MNKEELMEIAIEEALKGVRLNHGGPFGAIITRNGEIIASAHNEVLKLNDPTAHAEIQVIRKASRLLERFDLSDCELYTSCECCPMCLSAAIWAKIPQIYYGATRKDAAKSGFDDDYIYDYLSGLSVPKKLEVEQLMRDESLVPFKQWDDDENRVQY